MLDEETTVPSKPARSAVRTKTAPAASKFSPAQRRIYETLELADGRAVTVRDLICMLDGVFTEKRVPNLCRLVSSVRILLKSEGRKTIVAEGRLNTLAYALVDAPEARELTSEEQTAHQDAEILRLGRGNVPAALIALEVGYPSREAVIQRLQILRAAPGGGEVPVSQRRLAPPDGISLAPCGYARWSWRPGTAAHVVQFQGEEDLRILTAEDRSVRQLTTDRAKPSAPQASEEEA